MTAGESRSGFKLITDTPYLALTGELWGVYYESYEENWPRCNGTALYFQVSVVFSTWGTLVNLAEGRRTWQSSNWGPTSTAHLAVDGKDDPNFLANSCASTLDTGFTEPPVWAVDLGGDITDVYYVEVVNRDGVAGKLRQATQIYVCTVQYTYTLYNTHMQTVLQSSITSHTCSLSQHLYFPVMKPYISWKLVTLRLIKGRYFKLSVPSMIELNKSCLSSRW